MVISTREGRASRIEDDDSLLVPVQTTLMDVPKYKDIIFMHIKSIGSRISVSMGHYHLSTEEGKSLYKRGQDKGTEIIGVITIATDQYGRYW